MIVGYVNIPDEKKLDCISRKAVLDITWQDPSYSDPLNVLTEVRDKVRDLPSVTPQEPKTGHWIEGQTNNPKIHNIICSNCLEGYPSRGHANSQHTREKFKFCPNCGAKMESEVEE